MATLQLCDAMCPICLDILIEPVTLCCNHELCKVCYEDHFSKADFKCPLCKKRLNSWARQQAKCGTMVNVKKWNQIQEQFGSLIEEKESGKDIYQDLRTSMARVAKPGEVYKEYKKLKDEWSSTRKAEDQEQELASINYIKELLSKEKQQAEYQKKQLILDEEVAIELNRQLNSGTNKSIATKMPPRPHASVSSPLQKRRCSGIRKYFTCTQSKKAGNDTAAVSTVSSSINYPRSAVCSKLISIATVETRHFCVIVDLCRKTVEIEASNEE